MDEHYKIKTFVIDDEPLVLEDIVHQLNSSGFFEVIGTFLDLPAAFHAVDELGPPDFLLSDIHMSGPQGLNATKLFDRVCNFIVLMTAHEESAADACRTYPKGCVFKPLTIAELMPFVKEFHQLRKQGAVSNMIVGGKLYVNDKDDGILRPIPVGDITYAESHSDYVKIFAPKFVALPYMRMKKLSKMLADTNEFIRISERHLIAISHIEFMDGHIIYMPDNGEPEEVLLNVRKRKFVRREITKDGKKEITVGLRVTDFGKVAFERFMAGVKLGKYTLKEPRRGKKPNRDDGKGME